MAEALLKKMAGDRFEAESAGLEPGTINPFAIEAMNQLGIDISKNKTQSVFDVVKSGRLFRYVVTVCDEANGERCPIFAGIAKRLHWSFPDPSSLQGTYEQRLSQTVAIRERIRKRIEEWVAELDTSR